MKQTWLQLVREQSTADGFIDHPALAQLLSRWRQWGGETDAISWWQAASALDEGLLKLIKAFGSEVRSQTLGESAVRVSLRVNPKSFEPYGDVYAMADRVSGLIAGGSLDEAWRPAATQFVLECEMLKAGKNPDAPFAFDDD